MPELENPHGININMDQFTTNVVESGSPNYTVSGDGIFDTLMNTATKHVTAQFEAGRIRGEDYATTYTQLYQASLAAAVQIWLQKPIAELQKESEAAKRDLYRRQIEGFDEDYKQKIIKILLDSWAVGASVSRDAFVGTGAIGSTTNFIPQTIGKASIDSLYQQFIIKDFDDNKYLRTKSTATGYDDVSTETMIKDSQVAQSKLKAVDPNLAATAKTAAEQAYQAAMTAAVQEQVQEDVTSIG